MTDADFDRIAERIAQDVLRGWNGGGFRDSYFKSKKGLEIVTVARKVLERAWKQETPGFWTCIFCWEITDKDPCGKCGAPMRSL